VQELYSHQFEQLYLSHSRWEWLDEFLTDIKDDKKF
jgi:hypothetical protein